METGCLCVQHSESEDTMEVLFLRFHMCETVLMVFSAATQVEAAFKAPSCGL